MERGRLFCYFNSGDGLLSFLFESWTLQLWGLPLRDRSSLQKTPNFRLRQAASSPNSSAHISLDESSIPFIYFSYHFHSYGLLFRGVV